MRLRGLRGDARNTEGDLGLALRGERVGERLLVDGTRPSVRGECCSPTGAGGVPDEGGPNTVIRSRIRIIALIALMLRR